MNVMTIILWITILLIGVIAIILVKLHFQKDELEYDNSSIIPGMDNIQEKLSPNDNSNSQYFSNTQDAVNLRSEGSNPIDEYGGYIIPEERTNNVQDIEYESQNQVLINYDDKVEKFQEPMKENQMVIMNQRNNDKKHELKDLFTIDELINESKRKDDERQKESQKINNEKDDLTEIKESIQKNKEEKTVKQVPTHDIADAIKSSEETADEKVPNASQKEIEEVITKATKEEEKEEKVEGITEALLNTEKEISEPSLKSPSKIDDVSVLEAKDKDYKFGAPLEESELFTSDEDEMNDLDYRKDLAKITNTIKKSKLLQDVKEKLNPESEEIPLVDETYIRNANEYEEYEPIINETHADYDASYEEYHRAQDQRLRQDNTRKVFNMSKNEIEKPTSRINPIKSKPARDNIKIKISNSEYVLKKGDEIIFNYAGETYSSQVYAINGDDISVKYRRKNVTIKAEDVKKIY